MKPFVLLFALLCILASTPAQAQLAGTEPADLPQSGERDYWITYGYWDTHCVVVQASTRAGVVPYLREGYCEEGPVFTLHFIGHGRFTIEVGHSGNCATVARDVILGARRIDLWPCTNALDQQFSATPAAFGRELNKAGINLRSYGGCWTGRGSFRDSDFVEMDCDDRSTPLRLIDLAASRTPAAVATPVPAPPQRTLAPLPALIAPPTPAPRGRPEGIPDAAPVPGIYQAAATSDLSCIVPVRRGTDNWVLRGGRCNESPWENLLLEYPSSDGFVIYIPSIDRKCLTMPSGGRPWVELETCDTPTATQRFTVEQGERGGYRIKSQSGFCLTMRGDARAPQNNSALFLEPCRPEAAEQLFELRLLIDQRDR